MKIMEDKLKSTKIFIEPCLIQMKTEMENNNKTNTNNIPVPIILSDNQSESHKNRNIKNKKLENNKEITKTLQENESDEEN